MIVIFINTSTNFSWNNTLPIPKKLNGRGNKNIETHNSYDSLQVVIHVYSIKAHGGIITWKRFPYYQSFVWTTH